MRSWGLWAPAGVAVACFLGGSTAAAEGFLSGFGCRAEALALGTYLDLRESAMNPGNLMELPRWQAGIDLRPNLRFERGPIRLEFDPRLELRGRWFEDGMLRGTREWADSAYVNEWIGEARVAPGLFVSYGRENLQWGPSYLISPSNPFYRGNGQNNPRTEEPGLDYARAVWIAGRRWTFSAIANMDEGRLDSRREFERGYAFKTDFTGERWHASWILSGNEGDRRVAKTGFASWNLSDAVLVHGEWRIGGTRKEPAYLAGGSYTFEGGSFIVAEHFHDGAGCDAARIWDCFIKGGADTADLLLRRNYAMVQWTDPELMDRVNLTIRWIRGLDDHSDRIIGIYEQGIGDRFTLFATGGRDLGATWDEFGSLASGAVMAGMSVVF